MRFAFLVISLAIFAAEVRAQAPITALAVALDGRQVVAGSQAGVAIHSWPELKETGKLATGLGQVNDLAFSPDGKRLLVAGGAAGESGGVEIWTWPESKLVVKASPLGDSIFKAAWSARGDRIITASADGLAKVLDTVTLDEQAAYKGHSRSITAATWVHGDGPVATAGVDQTIQLWESANGAARRTLSNHVGTVNDLAFRPDVKEGPSILASVSEDKTVRLWQPIVGRLMRFAKLPSVPRTVVWLPSGEHLAVGCNDGVVRVLDFDELKTVQELAGEVGRIHAMALHAKDGKILVGGASGIRAITIPDLPAK